MQACDKEYKIYRNPYILAYGFNTSWCTKSALPSIRVICKKNNHEISPGYFPCWQCGLSLAMPATAA